VALWLPETFILFAAPQKPSAWDIRSGNWHLARDGINLLVKAREMRVQSTKLILLILVFQRLFSRRRGSIRALCLHLNQATGLFQLSRDPPPFFAVDQAIDDLTFAQNVCRCDQRKSRTACEKCPVTTPTDHSSATDQTTDLQEAGSAPLDCIGSLGYPFQNKQGKSFVENLARSVEQEEKIRESFS